MELAALQMTEGSTIIIVASKGAEWGHGPPDWIKSWQERIEFWQDGMVVPPENYPASPMVIIELQRIAHVF